MEDTLASLIMTDDEEDDTFLAPPYEKTARLTADDSADEPRRKGAGKQGGGGKKRPRRRKRMLTGVSKQRRAANERERKRLQIINTAFKELKHILPLTAGEENISKIEIVRLAATTIRHLAQIIEEGDNGTVAMERDMQQPLDGSGSSTDGTLAPLDFDKDDVRQPTSDAVLGEVDLSFLLFSPDDMRLDSVDSGLEIPSPTISETSSHDNISFPFIDHDMLDDDDVFCHGPTMIPW